MAAPALGYKPRETPWKQRVSPVSIAALLKTPRKEVVGLFSELNAPAVDELAGEYRATLLDQGRWANNFFTLLAFNLPGAWISKSFAPLTTTEGRGYNSFRVGRDVRKIYRMRTYLAPSRFDAADSFHLDYSQVAGQQRLVKFAHLAGELRRLGDNTYLGLGSTDFGIAQFHRAAPFVLEGPVAAFDDSVWAA